MGSFLGGFVLPLLLLAASLLNRSLISLVDLLIFLVIQFRTRGIGLDFWRLHVLRFTVIFSLLSVFTQIIVHVMWYIEGKEWSLAWWAKLLGLVSVETCKSASAINFLILQLTAALVAYIEVRMDSLMRCQDSFWWNFTFPSEKIGSHARLGSYILLPFIQLIVGISRPSWISLPFFICSCVGLVNWSLTSNFLGLFRWWRPLLIYSGFSILLLYIYQLPVEFPRMVTIIADFIGLYKITMTSEWPEISSGCCLLLFYYSLLFIKFDLEEMNEVMSVKDSSLSEQLLPLKHLFFIRPSRYGVRHTNVLLRGAIFQNFGINFFTYGFPVLLLALCFWSFSFASVSAFGLLAYVGYVLYDFPSLVHLHWLNGLLLVFILLWAVSTYVFNVAFTFLNKELCKDMNIWETIGLWHYSIPGLFLLAQFCLGALVAVCNLVNNSVLLYLSNEDAQSSGGDCPLEEKEDTKILIVATVAWALHRSSRAITLVLIFFLAMKPGFIHAVYMVFFLVYMLSHSITTKTRQSLILFCEVHFSLLYIFQLQQISKALEHSNSMAMLILSQFGLSTCATFWDFMEVGVLLCFCAVQNHGPEMLFSFSSIVQHSPYPPFGFSILKSGLSKSVLMSVYTSSSSRGLQSLNFSEDKFVAAYVSDVGQFFLNMFHSYGTYVVSLTTLLSVYLAIPNYISFGYLFLLLFWLIGRQLVEKTKRRLWFPLKVYTTLVFIFIYSLSISSTFQKWMSVMINLYPDLGFNPESSLLKNIWESLAVLVVMQLYSHERRQNTWNRTFDTSKASELGFLGFLRRTLIWHSEKILSAAVFYASLSPISAFGFLYLLGMIICSILPKASRIPSKVFLIYAGILVTFDYLFQLCGKLAWMLPGQELHNLSVFLGLKVYDSGFWGIESGLRSKVLVIVSCTFQYNVFYWLQNMPSSLVNKGIWEEPCPLFLSAEHASTGIAIHTEENRQSFNFDSTNVRQRCSTEKSCSSLRFNTDQKDAVPVVTAGAEESDSLSYMWGNSKEARKWNKMCILAYKKERFQMQKTTLKIYMKFWIENLFKLRGLEINMIALLVASFSVLNVISLFYILCLVIFILLKRQIIGKLWPMFVLSFACILVIEYVAIWNNLISWADSPGEVKVHCHDCWNSSSLYFTYCVKCWLGVIVDDPKLLVGYYVVFILASLKLRSDYLASFLESQTYKEMMSQLKNASVWREISFETKGLWTVCDYTRLYVYCHLLDIVLGLILITGTLEFDILHLGYLAFALVFFRMRLDILKKKNKIFKFLRLYNFTVIVLSLAYQSPFFGDFNSGKHEVIDYIYEVIGLYKYDYGFRITSRSAFVEIVIFLLASMQSYIFRSRESEYIARYLEAEQIGAIVREQEKKVDLKTGQLQHIRKSEEQKRQRNLLVEKMKSEMLNLQIQLNSMNSMTSFGDIAPRSKDVQPSGNSFLRINEITMVPNNENSFLGKQNLSVHRELPCFFDFTVPTTEKIDPSSPVASNLQDSPTNIKSESSRTMEYVEHSVEPICEIREPRERNNITHPNADRKEKIKGKIKDNPLISAVHLIGGGVSQVQSLGTQAVMNIVTFLDIDSEETDSNGYYSAEEEEYDEIEKMNNSRSVITDQISLGHSGAVMLAPPAHSQIRKIFHFIWAQMRCNNDVVCYCCFILVFLWNFSLFSMAYPATLFLYALCVNSGPSYSFWVIMLIYTEINILLQYLYQIIIQHCGLNIDFVILQRLGFPAHKIKASFVMSTLPLFLVYVSTLLQRSITAKEGEWTPVTEWKDLEGRNYYQEESSVTCWREGVTKLISPIIDVIKFIRRSFSRYWSSLTQGSESPPFFVQLSMKVNEWPEDALQPERIESGINQLLSVAHEERCKAILPTSCHSASRVRIQSIERSQENSGVALAVLEVIYASPLEGCETVKCYKSLTPAADLAKEILKAQSEGLFTEIRFPYPVISVIGGGKKEIDLYAYVFCADLAVFFLVTIFYQSIIKNSTKFLDVYQLEDQFPKEFVFILMILFFLIVLDRIIYLCSFATGKIIFYLFNLVLFTYSVTKYAWYMDPSHHVGGLALRAIYLTKAISLTLQALQIRYGIPHKSTLYQQFLTCKVTQIHYLGFRLYRALPFLYELRCVLDWSCTTTSLTMYDWLKLEDINASLFLVKCDVDLNRANHQHGQKQTKLTKFCSGICLFFILICVIWAPMLMYSSGNPTNIANPIKDVSVRIDIKAAGGRLTPFQTTLCEILPWEDMKVDDDLDPQHYLDAYNIKDIQLICCQSDASTIWAIPPVVQDKFFRSLDINMQIIFTWILIRERPKGKELVKYELLIEDPPTSSEVKKVLNGTSKSFRISDIYPRYFRVTGSGEVRLLEQTVTSVSADLFMNNGSLPWWSFHSINSLDAVRCKGLTGPMAIIVSEETPQGILGETLSKFSIWSLYISFVLAVGRFIRLQCSELRMRIPYENLPSCDRLIAICEGIYAARAEGELEVEELLYWTLVKIYRSPHLLLEYTKLN